MAASGACRLPAWTWERPRLDRTKTSHSGQTLRPLVELAEAVETGYPPVELAETGTSAAELVRTEISSPLVEPEPLVEPVETEGSGLAVFSGSVTGATGLFSVTGPSPGNSGLP
jgi:hypothetical protein